MTTVPEDNPTEDAFATRWSRISRLHDDGAEWAWRWFIDRYYPEIRAMLRRRLPSHLAAQAEPEFWGYLFVSRAITRAERERRFRPFLAGVVRNFARSLQRRQCGRMTSDDVLDNVAASAEPAFEQEELRAWARHTLVLALESMSRSHPHQTNVLRWFYGLSVNDQPAPAITVQEIAARLSKTPAAVHQHLTRGRLRLRSCMENEIREQVGSAADWRAEMQLVFGAIDKESPGLIPT